MANHVSAEKRTRQREVAAARNRSVRTMVRSALRKAHAALASGDKAVATETVQAASIALARAASKGVFHLKTASRTTSRIQSALAKLA